MRTFLLILAGALLVQTAWLLVVGPFRAIDEFDHAQRADSVSSGELRALPDGRVSVDPTFAAAARPVCLSHGPRPGSCDPEGVLDGGRVAVYDTAAAYDPVFYLIDGPPAQLFDGYARLYAMRLVASFLTAVAVAVGATILIRGFRTTWPGWLFLAMATPMATYTNMVVAPNGLESSCALVVWGCLLVALFGRDEVRSSSWPPLVAGCAGVLMGMLRTLGPFWLVTIVLAVLLASREPVTRMRELVARRAWRAAFTGWTLSCGAGVAWSLLARTNWPASGEPGSVAVSVAAGGTASSAAPVSWHLFPDILIWPFLWVLQNVGVIPYRDQPLPLVVYALVAALWVVLLVTAWRSGLHRVRRASGFVMLVSLAVPVAVSLFTYQLGWPWQGRYGWPLVMGVFLLAGVALDQTDFRPPPVVRRLVAPAIGTVMALAGVISQAHVLKGELATSPLAHSDAWFRLPMPVVALMTVAGFVLLVLAVERGGSAAPAVRRGGVDQESQARSDPAEAATH